MFFTKSHVTGQQLVLLALCLLLGFWAGNIILGLPSGLLLYSVVRDSALVQRYAWLRRLDPFLRGAIVLIITRLLLLPLSWLAMGM